MKKSIVYQRCENLAQIFAGLGYSVITGEDLKFLIMRYVGADPRTIRAYRRYLQEFNFITPRGNYFMILKTALPVQRTLTEEEVREK